MIANQDFIDGIEVRVARHERQQKIGVRVEPVFIGCIESQIDFVWPMTFEEDRELRLRLNKINIFELGHPESEMPPMIHIFG
jgi:hypothetical protein